MSESWRFILENDKTKWAKLTNLKSPGINTCTQLNGELLKLNEVSKPWSNSDKSALRSTETDGIHIDIHALEGNFRHPQKGVGLIMHISMKQEQFTVLSDHFPLQIP